MFSVDKSARNFPVAKKNIKGYFFTKIDKVKKVLTYFGENGSKIKTKQNAIIIFLVINSWVHVIQLV